LTPCTTNILTTPPCAPPNHSIMPER
jgi:hypothetical protein